MEKREFIDVLKELTEQENVLGVGREVNELRTQFEDYLIEATRQFQIAELEAKDRNEEFTEEDWILHSKKNFMRSILHIKKSVRRLAMLNVQNKKKTLKRNVV